MARFFKFIFSLSLFSLLLLCFQVFSLIVSFFTVFLFIQRADYSNLKSRYNGWESESEETEFVSLETERSGTPGTSRKAGKFRYSIVQGHVYI